MGDTEDLRALAASHADVVDVSRPNLARLLADLDEAREGERCAREWERIAVAERDAAQAEARRLRDALTDVVASWREEGAAEPTLVDETLLLCAREIEFRMEWAATPEADR